MKRAKAYPTYSFNYKKPYIPPIHILQESETYSDT